MNIKGFIQGGDDLGQVQTVDQNLKAKFFVYN